jgi:hypothetical protein
MTKDVGTNTVGSMLSSFLLFSSLFKFLIRFFSFCSLFFGVNGTIGIPEDTKHTNKKILINFNITYNQNYNTLSNTLMHYLDFHLHY